MSEQGIAASAHRTSVVWPFGLISCFHRPSCLIRILRQNR